MAITVTTWNRLLQFAVSRVPATAGVYELSTVHRETIFFGSAENLQLRLGQMIFAAQKHACLSRAWHFRYEETADSTTRLEELKSEFRSNNGKLPPCMEVKL
ncbi:MAG: hypothetical protein NTZ05_06945 [Chloroflexi bacterium]|nr:hypothetical protein [Chloroflexota bacterium]